MYIYVYIYIYIYILYLYIYIYIPPTPIPTILLSTIATSTSASLWDACCRVPQRGSLCGLAVLVDDGRAMSVKPRFVAELAEKDAFLRR